jgi:hypothetical protein
LMVLLPLWWPTSTTHSHSNLWMCACFPANKQSH